MDLKAKMVSVATSVLLAVSMVPAAAFAVGADGAGELVVGTMAVEPCGEGAHLWHVQPSSGDYVRVKCAVCGEEALNCVAVPVAGEARASELAALASEGLARLQRIDALRGCKKWVVLQLEGDAKLHVDADLEADCLVQAEGASGRFDLAVDGDGYHVLSLTDSGIRVQGDLRVDGGVVKAASTNGTALFAAGDMTLAGGKVDAVGCDYGVAALGALSVEGARVAASAADGLPYYAAVRGFQGVSVSGGTVRARGGAMGVAASGSVEVTGGEVDSRAGTAVFARDDVKVTAPAVVVCPEGTTAIEAQAAAGAGGAAVEGKALGSGASPAADVRITTAVAAEGDGTGTGAGAGAGAGDPDAPAEAPGTGRVTLAHYKLKVGGTPGEAADYEAVPGSSRSWGGLEPGSGFPLGLVAGYVRYPGFELSPTALNAARVAVTEDTRAGVYFDRLMVDMVIPVGVTATYANGAGIEPATVTITGDGTAKKVPYGAVLHLTVPDAAGKTGGTVSVDGGEPAGEADVAVGVPAPSISKPVYTSTKAEDAAASQTTAAAEDDVSGATFHKLRARATASSNTAIKVSWTGVSGATAYAVFGTPCGAGNKYVYLGKAAAGARSYAHEGLKKGRYHRYIVYALKGDSKILAKSRTVHACTNGGKRTNVKSVALDRAKATLAPGASLALAPVAINAKAGQDVKNHVARDRGGFRFESTDKKVASVTKAGKVRAKAAGTCYVYAFAQDGVWARVKVTVK